MDFTTFYILSIVFVATLVRSTFGFGESLIAVPLLSLLLPVEVAVPFSVLMSILIAAIVVVQDRREVHFESAKWLILYAMLGIPIGIVVLIYANDSLVKSLLGVFIISFALYSLLVKSSSSLENPKRWLFICGFLSGIMGGAYGLNGPPLVIYGKMSNWTAKSFRATLQAYFLPTSMVGMCAYWYKGLWTSAITHYFLISIPIIIPAIFIGRYFNHHLTDGKFLKYVYVGLVGIGLILIIQSLLR